MEIDDSLGLDVFGSESNSTPSSAAPFPTPEARRRRATGQSWRALRLPTFVVVALAVSSLGAYEYRRHPPPWTSPTGSVTFDTVPSGIEVFVREKSIGRSPVTIALTPGTYDVRLGERAAARLLTVAVPAGASIVQHYEMTAAPAVTVATTGALRIQTEPVGLPVSLDGVAKGASPITLEDVNPGEHDILVGGQQGPVKRVVRVVAGETGSVFISSGVAAPDAGGIVAGWLSLKSVVSLQVREGGRLLGSSDIDKLMLPSGEHDLELTNDLLGYQTKRRVRIAAGKTTVSSIEVPNGTLSLNALPWAEVFVDGKSLGQTPIGNLSLPIGTHDVVFRHPDLGERKETVNVTTRSTTRLGVDLKKK